MKSPYFNPQTGNVEWRERCIDENGENLLRIEAMPGIDGTGYNCFQQTSVSLGDISVVIIETMKEACRLAQMVRIRFMTDALFLSGYSNINRSNMISLFAGSTSFSCFAHSLADIIDQQERTESFSEEMLPLFIRQFEDANVIRKTRQAEKSRFLIS